MKKEETRAEVSFTIEVSGGAETRSSPSDWPCSSAPHKIPDAFAHVCSRCCFLMFLQRVRLNFSTARLFSATS